LDFTKRHAGTVVPGPGGLAQQILTDTPVPRVPAFAAHQLPEATLRSHHAFTGRLLE
jgi:hypothetical protein